MADPRIRVFDKIAWFYGLVFGWQRRTFRRIQCAHFHRLGLPARVRILDIGCGNGAHMSVLAEDGHDVWAVDASPGMVATARRLFQLHGLSPDRLSLGNPLDGLAFPDRHFDLVFAAQVLHGLLPEERRRFCAEASRVSRNLVLFQDYPPAYLPGPGLVERILEALERSDYRRFMSEGLQEMREVFATVEVVSISPGLAWYLCRVKP